MNLHKIVYRSGAAGRDSEFNNFVDELIETLQSSHLNFLIGAGLSAGYLKTLGNIEKWLSDLEDQDLKT